MGIVSGCGESLPSLGLDFQIHLSDDSFCPRGSFLGNDHVDVQLRVRSQGASSRQITGVDGRWVLRSVPGDSTAAKGRTAPPILEQKPIRFLGTFGKSWELVDFEWSFNPPTSPGHYQVELHLAGTQVVLAQFGVWYDEQACPDPGNLVTAISPPPEASVPPPLPVPKVSVAPGASGSSPLSLELESDWSCDDAGGLQDLLIRVTVRHTGREGRGLRIPGVVVKGIPELDPLERVEGELREGYLLPGKSLRFEAHGWANPGDLRLDLSIPGLPKAGRVETLKTRCPR
jgi:hypothetical protein